MKLSSDEIVRIKNIIASRMRDYNGSDLSWVHGFENSINTIVYEMINDNVLASGLDMRDSSSGSGFVTYRSDRYGIISYYSDDLTGYTAGNITADTFETADRNMHNLRTAGLVAAGTPVYRICSDDNWSVIVKVSEDFYVNNL